MAVLLSDNGSAFPVLSGPYADGGIEAITILRELKTQHVFRAYKPSACLGAASSVSALGSAMAWRSALDMEYDAMCRQTKEQIPPLSSSTPGIVGYRQASHVRATYRRATAADLDELYPLAAAYEKSEVMTPIHVFDPSSCRAAQARSLASQVVFVAIVHGNIVARAQTNARGWSTDQIGGVYVKQEFRGLGIGRGVVDSLVSDIAGHNRHVSLFVKKTNSVALSLYRSMGFCTVCDYRVSYF